MDNRYHKYFNSNFKDFTTCYIIFENDTDIGFLKFLKKGFRHCFVVCKFKEEWVILDPLASSFSVNIIKISEVTDIIKIYKNMGHKILRVSPIEKPSKMAPIGLFTCVEFIKRFIGIRNYRLITPYSLYTYMIINRKKFLTNEILSQPFRLKPMVLVNFYQDY